MTRITDKTSPRMIRRALFFAAVLLYCSVPAFPVALKTMSAGFVREVKADGKTEKAKGTIYYLSGTVDKIILKIFDPVEQWMIFEGKTLLIYYPKSNQAFTVESRNPLVLPFFQFFMDITKEDFGLSARGFQFVRYEKKPQELISFWTPPKELAQFIGEIVLTHQDNALLKVQTKDPKGTAYSDVVYGRHVLMQGVSFPLQITITTYEKKSPSQEAIVFNDLQINRDIPADIINFSVPPGAAVKNVKW